jgi:MFS transporter, ACS family, tartrate transporter
MTSPQHHGDAGGNVRECVQQPGLHVAHATYACKGPFWALATEALPASISAAAIAQINALGSLPGFGASYLIGAIKDATGSYPIAIMPIAALCLAGVIGVLFLGQRQPSPAQPARQAGGVA